MFKASEQAKQKTFEKVQKQKKQRKKELIKRLEEKASVDPNGIWKELLLEARQNNKF